MGRKGKEGMGEGMGGEEGRRERRDSQEQQCEGSGKKGWEKGRGVRGRKKGKVG